MQLSGRIALRGPPFEWTAAPSSKGQRGTPHPVMAKGSQLAASIGEAGGMRWAIRGFRVCFGWAQAAVFPRKSSSRLASCSNR